MFICFLRDTEGGKHFVTTNRRKLAQLVQLVELSYRHHDMNHETAGVFQRGDCTEPLTSFEVT